MEKYENLSKAFSENCILIDQKWLLDNINESSDLSSSESIDLETKESGQAAGMPRGILKLSTATDTSKNATQAQENCTRRCVCNQPTFYTCNRIMKTMWEGYSGRGTTIKC